MTLHGSTLCQCGAAKIWQIDTWTLRHYTPGLRHFTLWHFGFSTLQKLDTFAPWNFGILEFRHLDNLALIFGTSTFWHSDILALRHHGTLALWHVDTCRFDTMTPCQFDTLTLRLFDSLALRDIDTLSLRHPDTSPRLMKISRDPTLGHSDPWHFDTVTLGNFDTLAI